MVIDGESTLCGGLVMEDEIFDIEINDDIWEEEKIIQEI